MALRRLIVSAGGDLIVGRKAKVSYVNACPCHRTFEDEQLCINEDPIKLILTMSVDKELIGTEFVSQAFSKKENDDNLCFCLIYLDEEDDRFYCLSQNRRILVSGEEVTSDDMKRALEMLVPENTLYEPELCNECLYNVLTSLKKSGNASCFI
ncbi:MAG: hypothetical protein ACFFE3_10465 [Candidatus Thorarchaeota archaeon]